MSKEESTGLKTRNGNGKSKEVKKSHGESNTKTEKNSHDMSR